MFYKIRMVKEKVVNETNEEKFKRIATKRANKILEGLRLLGNCANKGIYSYNEKQINQIFSTIEDEIKYIKSLFKPSKKRKIEL